MHASHLAHGFAMLAEAHEFQYKQAGGWGNRPSLGGPTQLNRIRDTVNSQPINSSKMTKTGLTVRSITVIIKCE